MELGLVSKFYSILIHFIWFNTDLIRFDALISQFCSILITFASDLICFDAMNYCWVSTLISRIIVFGIHEVHKIWSDSQGWFNWSWDKKILFSNIVPNVHNTWQNAVTSVHFILILWRTFAFCLRKWFCGSWNAIFSKFLNVPFHDSARSIMSIKCLFSGLYYVFVHIFYDPFYDQNAHLIHSGHFVTC